MPSSAEGPSFLVNRWIRRRDGPSRRYGASRRGRWGWGSMRSGGVEIVVFGSGEAGSLGLGAARAARILDSVSSFMKWLGG